MVAKIESKRSVMERLDRKSSVHTNFEGSSEQLVEFAMFVSPFPSIPTPGAEITNLSSSIGF